MVVIAGKYWASWTGVPSTSYRDHDTDISPMLLTALSNIHHWIAMSHWIPVFWLVYTGRPRAGGRRRRDASMIHLEGWCTAIVALGLGWNSRRFKPFCVLGISNSTSKFCQNLSSQIPTTNDKTPILVVTNFYSTNSFQWQFYLRIVYNGYQCRLPSARLAIPYLSDTTSACTAARNAVGVGGHTRYSSIKSQDADAAGKSCFCVDCGWYALQQPEQGIRFSLMSVFREINSIEIGFSSPLHARIVIAGRTWVLVPAYHYKHGLLFCDLRIYREPYGMPISDRPFNGSEWLSAMFTHLIWDLDRRYLVDHRFMRQRHTTFRRMENESNENLLICTIVMSSLNRDTLLGSTDPFGD